MRTTLEESIDRVLAKEASTDSVSKHVQELRQGGDGKDNFAKYFVFQIELEGGDKPYSRTYLRGFEKRYAYHKQIATDFLKELPQNIREYFDLPRAWPTDSSRKCEKDIIRERDGLTLNITALGGGRYNFSDNTINTWGLSTDFELPPPNEFLPELLGELVRTKEPYQGFKGFNIGPTA